MNPVKLNRVEIENLRGYYSASLSLSREKTVIVGPNNSGKTSVLRILDWVFNRLDQDLLEQRRTFSQSERTLLLPARETQHRARRLTLLVSVPDKRSRTKFLCDADGQTQLRFNLRLTPHETLYVALGPARRGESTQSSKDAIELFQRLKESIAFIHIPSFRDAISPNFLNTLREAFRTKIEERALHASVGGAPKEYRDVARVLQQVKNVMLDLTKPLWDDVKLRLPAGMATAAKIQIDCDQQDLLGFLEDRIGLKIATGAHDESAVPLEELGSGLQSLLDLAFQESASSGKRKHIVAIEEPEAFLHPAAQRSLITRLLASASSERNLFLTTHSPVIVEETMYGDITICRDQRFYPPKHNIERTQREEINTALMSGFGAEMVFGTATLFVEGEGDRQFFERIRRRVASYDESGRIDNCFVVPVGGKTSFAPWMRLLDAYGTKDNRPIGWLVVADADASTEIRKAFADAGISLSKDLLSQLSEMASAKNTSDWDRLRSASRTCNRTTAELQIPMQFLVLDLEEAALSRVSENTVESFAYKVFGESGMQDNTEKDKMLHKLGATGYVPNSKTSLKAPWIRGYIGQRIPPSELSECVKQTLQRWFAFALGETDAQAVLSLWEDQ